jgi:hypothetical protein
LEPDRPIAVAGRHGRTAPTSSSGVLVVCGGRWLRHAWVGDRWQQVTTGAAPLVLGLIREGPWPWSMHRLFLQVDEADLIATLERCLVPGAQLARVLS